MKLRIRFLESPPKNEPKLLDEIYISGYGCSDWKLSINRTLPATQAAILTRQISDGNQMLNVFLHRSRVFYINVPSTQFYDIFTDDGKFVTSIPRKYIGYWDWHSGDFLSYNDKLLFVQSDKSPEYGMLYGEDFFRDYKIILGNGYLQWTRPRNIIIFKNTFRN